MGTQIMCFLPFDVKYDKRCIGNIEYGSDYLVTYVLPQYLKEKKTLCHGLAITIFSTKMYAYPWRQISW